MHLALYDNDVSYSGATVLPVPADAIHCTPNQTGRRWKLLSLMLIDWAGANSTLLANPEMRSILKLLLVAAV